MGLSSPTYQLAGWQAGDTGLVDGNGVTWGVNRGGTAGVFDGPDVRLNQSPFPNADGAQRSRNFRPPRTFTLNGWATAPSPAALEASRRQFVNLLADGSQSPLMITYLDGLVVTALVERAAIPKAAPIGPLELTWQLTLSAVDPSLYATVVSQSTGLPSSSGGLDWVSGGGLNWVTGGGLNWGVTGSTGLITVTNHGYAPSWPTFTITGPVTNPTVVNTASGQELLFTDTLSANDTVVLRSNPINRAALKNGTPYRVNLTVAQWFSIPGQGSIAVQFQGLSTGTPTLSVSLSDAY